MAALLFQVQCVMEISLGKTVHPVVSERALKNTDWELIISCFNTGRSILYLKERSGVARTSLFFKDPRRSFAFSEADSCTKSSFPNSPTTTLPTKPNKTTTNKQKIHKTQEKGRSITRTRLSNYTSSHINHTWSPNPCRHNFFMHKHSYTRQRQQYKASRPFKWEFEKRGWAHLLRTRWSDDWRPCYRQAQRSASSVMKCVARPDVPTPPHASSLIRGALRVLAMVTLDCSAVFPPEMFVDPLQILANTLQSSHSLPVESLTMQMLHALFNYWFVVSQQVEFVPSGGFSRLLHHDWSPNWPLLCTLFLVILTSGLRFCLGRRGRKVRTIRPTAPFLNDVRVERKMTRNESKKRNGERSSKPGVRFKGYTIGSVVRSEKTGETSVRFIRYLVAPAFIPEIHIFQ